MSATADRPLRVVVAEDSFLFRAGVVRVLEDAGFAVVGEARDAEELLDAGRASTGPTSSSPTSACRRPTPTRACAPPRSSAPSCPQTGVLVLSQYVKESYALRLLGDSAAGVGYLLKHRVMEPRGFADAVRQVARGGSALDPEVVAQMLERRRRGGPLDDLSERELDVLAGMAEGRSNPRDRAATSASASTPCSAHIASIFGKLDLPAGRRGPPPRARRPHLPPRAGGLTGLCVTAAVAFLASDDASSGGAFSWMTLGEAVDSTGATRPGRHDLRLQAVGTRRSRRCRRRARGWHAPADTADPEYLRGRKCAKGTRRPS